MNKLQTNYNGGMPLELDDIRWEQAAVREAFYGIISAFGITKAESYKLSGCAVTKNGNDYHCNEGYIVLEGEVYKVDAHDLTISTPLTHKPGFAVDTTYDASGLETFEDLSTHNTYEIRKAKLVSVAITLPQVDMYYGSKYLTEIIFSLANTYESWHLVGGTNEPAFESAWSNKGTPDSVVGFRKDNNGIVHIKGVVTSAGSQGLIFTLPAAYRPSAVRSFVTCYQGAVKSIQVSADGYVWLNTSNSTDVSLDFSFAI